MFKEPKLFGKDEDGYYLGRIEEIGWGNKEDMLMISNRKQNLWVLSIFSGYRQIGCFDVDNPHDFEEGDLVIVTKKDNKIINVVIEDKNAEPVTVIDVS